MPRSLTWSLAPASPAAAPRHFPYDHATVEQTDTSDPIAWRRANAARFDALYGPQGELAAPSRNPAQRAARLNAARAWREAHKAQFDAIYGP
jgi:hypothetical protein